MALYSFFSATGAPGVTTTAVAAAIRWPRHVILVDADASASQAIAAGYTHGALPHDRGMMDLAAAARHNEIETILPSALIRFEGTNADFLQGPRSPLQAHSLQGLWPAFLQVFQGLDPQGTDVIFDLGRLGTDNFANAVLMNSDRAVLMTRSNLPAIVGSHWHATQLAEHFGLAEGGRQLHLGVVGQGQPYSARSISKKLGIANTIPIANDATMAEHFSLGSDQPRRRLGSSALLRSIDAMISTLRETEPLDPEGDDNE